MSNKTKKCLYRYLNVLQYKLNVFYVSYFDVLCNISFKDHLSEDGHNKWPKHVRGYAV